jgi:hypothetical protein
VVAVAQQRRDGVPTGADARQRAHGRAAGVQREDRALEVSGAFQAGGFAPDRFEHGVIVAAQAQRVTVGRRQPDGGPGGVKLAARLPWRAPEAAVAVLRAGEV